MEPKSPTAHRRALSVDDFASSSAASNHHASTSPESRSAIGISISGASSSDSTKTINREELERFIATRKLPEAVLQQLRARATLTPTSTTPRFGDKMRSQSSGSIKLRASDHGTSTSASLPGPELLRKVDGSIIDREAKGLPAPERDSRMKTLGPEILRKPGSRDSSTGKQRSGDNSNSSNSLHSSTASTPVEDSLLIGSVPPPPPPSSSATSSTNISTGPSPQPSPRGTAKSNSFPSLDINAISPAHKLPFNLESHTQQGIDEFHAEENQDRHCFGYDFQRQIAWLGISDGHVGSGAADYIARNVIKNIQSCQSKGPPANVEELTSAIAKGIKLTEERFKKQDDASGACLVLACLWGRTLVIANVGDSRAVLGTYRSGAIAGVQLTVDHNATTESEAKLARFRFLRNQGDLKDISDPNRISNDELIAKIKDLLDGDDIISHGRVFTSECTRTIGDFGLKKACFGVIICDPEFTVVQLSDADHHLILACDGIWKTVSSQRAAELVSQAIAAPSRNFSPAEKLIRDAVEHGSGDDQTCLVLDLFNYKNCLTQTTDIATKIFKGLSVFDHHTAQEIASSAHRTFQAKMARMNARGELANKNTRGMFEIQAQQNQAFISSAHKSANKFNRVPANPAPYAGLSLFESQAMKQNTKPANAPPPSTTSASNLTEKLSSTPSSSSSSTPVRVRKSISNRSLTKSTPGSLPSKAQTRSISPTNNSSSSTSSRGSGGCSGMTLSTTILNPRSVTLSRSADCDVTESISPPGTRTISTPILIDDSSSAGSSGVGSLSSSTGADNNNNNNVNTDHPRQCPVICTALSLGDESLSPVAEESKILSFPEPPPAAAAAAASNNKKALSTSVVMNFDVQLPVVRIDSPKPHDDSTTSSSSSSLQHREHHQYHHHQKSA